MSLLDAVPAVLELDSLDRRRAEMLFALSVLNARRGYLHVAKGYGRECLALLGRIGTDTCAECATSTTSIYGVLLPDFLHQDTVRAALKPFKIRI